MPKRVWTLFVICCLIDTADPPLMWL